MGYDKRRKNDNRFWFICGLLLFILMSNQYCVVPRTVETEQQTKKSGYSLLRAIPETAKYITSDKLQQLYVLTFGNELVKYNPSGEELFRFTENKYGQAEYVDVTDPFNILLFYPDFGTVLSLNRTLTKTGEFNLFDLELSEIKTLAASNDNHIWIYDDIQHRLKKIDRKGNLLLESEDLNLRFGELIEPNFLLERENYLLVNVPRKGVLVFDNFAKYQKILDFKALQYLQLIDEQLIFYKKGNLKAFQLQSLNQKSILLPEEVRDDDLVNIQKNRLYIAKEDHIKVYSF